MKPEEGWVTDLEALHMVFLLRGVQPGDQLRARMRHGRLTMVEETVRNQTSADYVNTAYGNPTCSNTEWRILAWRPAKEKQ